MSSEREDNFCEEGKKLFAISNAARKLAYENAGCMRGASESEKSERKKLIQASLVASEAEQGHVFRCPQCLQSTEAEMKSDELESDEWRELKAYYQSEIPLAEK